MTYCAAQVQLGVGNLALRLIGPWPIALRDSGVCKKANLRLSTDETEQKAKTNLRLRFLLRPQDSNLDLTAPKAVVLPVTPRRTTR